MRFKYFQTLTSKINSDYLVIILDLNYFSNDGFLDSSSSIKISELLNLLILFRKKNNSKIIFSNISGKFLL